MNRKYLPIILILLAIGLAGCGLQNSASGLGSSLAGYKYLVVNFALSAAVLFILQAFLMKTDDKNTTQRTALQAAVLIIAGFIAYSFRTDYLWKISYVQNFMHVKVLINLVVVSIGLIVLKELIPFIGNRFKEDRQAKIFILFAIIIGVMVALAPFKVNDQQLSWQQLGEGKYYPLVWEAPTGIKIKMFLLGDSNCVKYKDESNPPKIWKGGGKYCYNDKITLEEIHKKNPNYLEGVSVSDDSNYKYGILRVPYIGIWIAVGLILAWVFSFLKFGPDGNQGKYAQWGFAFFLAITMANEGMGIRAAVQMSEMLLFFLFWRGTISAGGITNQLWAGVLSGYMVNFVAVKTFPNDQVLGFLGTWLVNPMNLFLVIPFLLILTGAGFLGKAGVKGVRELIRKDFLRALRSGKNRNHIKLRNSKGTLGRLARNVRLSEMEDDEPTLLREIRPILMVLQNYLERAQTLIEKGSLAMKTYAGFDEFSEELKGRNTREYEIETFRGRRSGSGCVWVGVNDDAKREGTEGHYISNKGYYDWIKANPEMRNWVLNEELVPAGESYSLETKNHLGFWNLLTEKSRFASLFAGIHEEYKVGTYVPKITETIAKNFSPNAFLKADRGNNSHWNQFEYQADFLRTGSSWKAVRLWNVMYSKLHLTHHMLNLAEGNRNIHPSLMAVPEAEYREWVVWHDKDGRISEAPRHHDGSGWNKLPGDRAFEVDNRGYIIDESLNSNIFRTKWYHDDYPLITKDIMDTLPPDMKARITKYKPLEVDKATGLSEKVIVKRVAMYDRQGRKQVFIMPPYLILSQGWKKDWDLLIRRDLRDGTYHANSFSWQDYLNAEKNENTYPDKVKGYTTKFRKDASNPAIDLRALRFPGLFKSQGRFKALGDSFDSANPDPAVTSLGLTRFIQWEMTRSMTMREARHAAETYVFADRTKDKIEDPNNIAGTSRGLQEEEGK